MKRIVELDGNMYYTEKNEELWLILSDGTCSWGGLMQGNKKLGIKPWKTYKK